MNYSEFIPGNTLKPYVKCYYLYESDTNQVFEDKAFATGCIEIMFNLGTGRWQTDTGNGFQTTPLVELWGQVIQPISFKSLGANIMMGIRFYPHTASIFLNTDVSSFNNQVRDLIDISGAPVKELHSQLFESAMIQERIGLVEQFLLNRLYAFEHHLSRPTLIREVMCEMKRNDFFDNIDKVASRYGITSRYLQKLFSYHTGLTPKLYSKINRFQNSLRLVSKKKASLTSIAYDCGYFDQSHFIREFKTFTGVVPSCYNPVHSSAILASPDN
jgi:AraC-like DNA-binding protein